MTEVLLPSQLDAIAKRVPGDQRSRLLMVAVFELAVEDIRKNNHPGVARAYLLSDDTEWPYSARNICATLGFDLDRIRRELGLT